MITPSQKETTAPRPKGLALEETRALAKDLGEPAYRGDQLFGWLHKTGVQSYDEATNLPKRFRAKLEALGPPTTLALVEFSEAPDGSGKFLFRTESGELVESALIPGEGRATLCVSTQVGCPLDCAFCATGKMGFRANLDAGEILDQYLMASRRLDVPITNVVYMGMGEPLLNYDATVRSLRLLLDERAIGLGRKRVTVSTAGVPPAIDRLADEGVRVKLAISVHSPFEDVRSRIAPVNRKYSLADTLAAAERYARATDTRVTLEYAAIANINDRDEDARALAKIAGRFPSKVNVIPLNPVPELDEALVPSPPERVERFVELLRAKNVDAFVRKTVGREVEAACGQLTTTHNTRHL
ncbi:MAG: 23S rRNA (adenine(2503)-C(2))-methyltransferase RlmN [Ignavibacteriales bacterium]|nr:23S rRNA (adenine(2503)-C(2))-methyltransferase RlmN [Ignavibacteriales bacterium]